MVTLPRSRKQAFTLIELLVVIAIIGILSALLFPSIQCAILTAKVTKGSNAGGQIWKAIYAKNLENEPNNFPAIWPVSTGAASIVPYLPVDPGGVATFADNMDSSEYFAWMVATEILPVNYGFFALPPQTPALDKAALMAGDACGWSMVLNGAEQASSSPFLVTRNMNFGGDWKIDYLNEPLNVEKGSPNNLFGGKRAIVINFGGAAKSFDLSALKLAISEEAVAPGCTIALAEGGLDDASFVLSGPAGGGTP
jgi:prepilin-type N-terminal cleavage/methylation domain-containing protein